MPRTKKTKEAVVRPNLAAALSAAQLAMRHVERTATNEAAGSRYATLAAVLDAVREPLAQNGLAITQPVQCDGQRVTVVTRLLHTGGESIESAITILTDGTPWGIGSAISYGRRYGICAIVGLAQADDDAQAAQRGVVPRKVGLRQVPDAGGSLPTIALPPVKTPVSKQTLDDLVRVCHEVEHVYGTGTVRQALEQFAHGLTTIKQLTEEQAVAFREQLATMLEAAQGDSSTAEAGK